MCFYKSLDFMDLLKKVEIKICSGSLPELGGQGEDGVEKPSLPL